jgi:hypothetical protein
MNVYFFVATNQTKRLLKIGKANDIQRRLSQVQVGCPYRVTLLGFIELESDRQAYQVEKLLHQRFSRFRTNSGGEWFRMTKDVENDCRSLISEAMR